MGFNFHCVHSATKPGLVLSIEQLLYQAARLIRQGGRQADWTLQNLVEQLLSVSAVKGGNANQHFIDESSQTPPVSRSSMARSCQYFGRQVLRRAAERRRRDVVVDAFLGQAEICEFDVPVRVQQDVLGFEVSIHDAKRVQILQRKGDLGSVPDGSVG